MGRTCDACGEQSLTIVADLGEVPIYCGAHWATADEARSSPTGRVQLAACSGCGYVRNLAFDPRLVVYDARFDYDLHHSGVIRAVTSELAGHLTRTYDLDGGHVLDIRCGQGELLREICDRSGARGTGFDPTFRGCDSPAVRCYREAAPIDGTLPECDLVLCRHWLEHVDDPGELLARLAKHAAGRPLVAYLEVPHAGYDLATAGWEVIYPHVSYFGETALRRLVARTGWQVRAVGTPMSGLLLAMEISTHDPEPPAEPTRAGAPDRQHLALIAGFAERHDRVRAGWRSRLDDLVAAGARPVLWGAGSRGVQFLNAVDPARRLAGVVDVNPRKWGRHLPVAGHRVDPPDSLAELRPEVVIITNPAYRTEIATALTALGVAASIEEA